MDAQKWTNGCVVPLAWCAVANDPINITNIYCKGITHHPPFKKTSNLTDHGGSTLRFWWTNPSTNIVSACRPHKNCLLEKTPSSTNIMSCSMSAPQTPKNMFEKTTSSQTFWPQVTSNFAPAVHNDHRWVPWSESCFGSGHHSGKLLGPAWWQDLG